MYKDTVWVVTVTLVVLYPYSNKFKLHKPMDKTIEYMNKYHKASYAGSGNKYSDKRKSFISHDPCDE